MDFSREKLIASDACPTDTVKTEHGDIRVAKPMHGPMRRYFEGQGKVSGTESDAQLLLIACIDDKNKPLFGSLDAAKKALDGLSTESMMALQTKILELYNSDDLKKQVEAMKGKAPEGNSEGSPSAS